MDELKQCPKCKKVPNIGYVCGEYFIFSINDITGMCVCSSFCEMHASEEQEIDAWNRRADNENQSNAEC